MPKQIYLYFILMHWDRSLFIEGLVPKRNWLNQRRLLIEYGCADIL